MKREFRTRTASIAVPTRLSTYIELGIPFGALVEAGLSGLGGGMSSDWLWRDESSDRLLAQDGPAGHDGRERGHGEANLDQHCCQLP